MSQTWHDGNEDADNIQNCSRSWPMLLKQFLLISQTIFKTSDFIKSFYDLLVLTMKKIL